MNVARAILALLAVGVVVSSVRAEVKMASDLFSQHMVLQRDVPVPIWGKADPDEAVEIKFLDQTHRTVADRNGMWMVTLQPMPARSEPAELVVTGKNKLTISDVLIGEVWLGSGQSNLAGAFGDEKDKNLILAKRIAVNPLIRVSRPDNRGKILPWEVATEHNIKNFSVMMTFFGAELQPSLKVPVGLIVRAVPGSHSAGWTDKAGFESDKNVRDKLQAFEKAVAEGTAKRSRGDANREVGLFFKQAIEPLAPYAIRGVAWDQGESHSGIHGLDQFTMMKNLIESWRACWNRKAGAYRDKQRAAGDFIFLLNQKPNGFGGLGWTPRSHDAKGKPVPAPSKLPKLDPIDNSLPIVRVGNFGSYSQPYIYYIAENYVQISKLPNVGMSMVYGFGGGLHFDAAPAGRRLASKALGLAYARKDIMVYGPMYKSMAIEKNRIRIKFDHVGSGLLVGGPKLVGFSIAGEDKNFIWADAVMDGDSVIVSSDKIESPRAVRYNFWTIAGNLFNKEGEPAIIFRTDDWGPVYDPY